ncbi:hypothetical protein [Halomonas korlensis]|uniref:Uncharacterized protein n=1 Tax=Halomonas korlensis TaxID=463301 RepID=A0A1I7KGP7_9GAMM|nr:hypothetical protein [Halomonas korlensis]SFU96599.1 hypothetical protein SAMN04487955_1209 [Halomonas korlensis]
MATRVRFPPLEDSDLAMMVLAKSPLKADGDAWLAACGEIIARLPAANPNEIDFTIHTAQTHEKPAEPEEWVGC